MTIWDTAGQEEFENIRRWLGVTWDVVLHFRLTYPGTDLFIVCFSMVDRASFENVKNVVSSKQGASSSTSPPSALQWLKDLHEGQAKVPKFLLGTKKDLIGKKPGSFRRTTITHSKQNVPTKRWGTN